MINGGRDQLVGSGLSSIGAVVNIAMHLPVGHTSMDAVASRVEAPLRSTVAEISTRPGYRPVFE